LLTNDPLYWRPLQPVITIKTTVNTSTLYTYSSFTGTATGVTTVFPHHTSVSLSQNTHGEFTIQFYDATEALEAAGVTVGSRVIIECGKQSSAITRLISGIVRKKGYSRGSDGKVLYTISGTSTGIRLNEIIRYVVSQATKTGDGITPNIADATRKADTLLATNLAPLTTDAILSIANLAANSDVETFIASLSIEYGQLQDIVNYIEQQSGGQVVVDTNDLVNFRYEIKNNFSGRGFTLKNKYTGAATDDADDTMYLMRKNWTYEDDFYTSANYSNKITAILPGEPRPSTPLDLGFVSANVATVQSTNEYAIKFRPPHTRFTPGDIYLVAAYWSTAANSLPGQVYCRICKDASGVPMNTNGIIANIIFVATQFQDPLPTVIITEITTLINDQFFVNDATGAFGDFYLDTQKDYWLIISHDAFPSTYRFTLGRNMNVASSSNLFTHTSNFSTTQNGGSGWALSGAGTLPAFGVGRYRAQVCTMWDPKATQAIQVGLTPGQHIESMVTESAVEIKSRESLFRHMAGQLYVKARPRTSYNFPTVTASNTPIFPGDPIVISDSVLGLSTSGSQVILTTCGDMTYSWGNMEGGGYEAPTKLNIQAMGVHPRYR
jgi:hypothetical protein